jgi:hypothetical protein
LAIARNLAAPGEVLDLLVNYGWGEVTESIAKHPNASEDALVKLLQRYEDFIEGRIKPIDNLPQPLKLIQNPDTPSSALEKIDLNNLPSHFKQNDNLPILLSEYVQSQTPFVRFICLTHPLIPIEFLQQHSQSLFWWERYAIAINSATPLER